MPSVTEKEKAAKESGLNGIDEREIRMIRHILREVKTVQDVIDVLTTMKWSYRGLTSGLPVSPGDDSLIFHHFFVRGNCVQVYLNPEHRTFMVRPLEQDLLYVGV